MKKINQYLLTALTFLCIIDISSSQENAAPSIHLDTRFTSNDLLLKMNKIKITESADASYFEVNGFTLGYTGLQQTPDPRFGHSNIFIFSVWDPNTLNGIFSKVEYAHPTTDTGRFGGEGNGWRSINPVKWSTDRWYNVVTRSWKSKGLLYIANFIQDLTTNKWFHISTMSIPDPRQYLGAYNDAFLENWDGFNPKHDGRFRRTAYLKDAWCLNLVGGWEKNTSTKFIANGDTDLKRNGIYHNSFNAFYDSAESAYCIQHGGDIKPSSSFGGSRELVLPTQSNQGDNPLLKDAKVTEISAIYADGICSIDWKIDDIDNPQLSYEVTLKDESGKIILRNIDTVPHQRNIKFNILLTSGKYMASLQITDIFNQKSKEIESKEFVVKGLSTVPILHKDGYVSLKVFPNPGNGWLSIISSRKLNQVNVLDIMGRKVMEINAPGSTLDLSRLCIGTYFLHVLDENSNYFRKIVIDN